ncbi:MAG: hypothetical protein HYW78_02855 [Parcubacteria group bacterium]|nr:hypothetical protein [Parcubacteria group bacterium]
MDLLDISIRIGLVSIVVLLIIGAYAIYDTHKRFEEIDEQQEKQRDNKGKNI